MTQHFASQSANPSHSPHSYPSGYSASYYQSGGSNGAPQPSQSKVQCRLHWTVVASLCLDFYCMFSCFFVWNAQGKLLLMSYGMNMMQLFFVMYIFCSCLAFILSCMAFSQTGDPLWSKGRIWAGLALILACMAWIPVCLFLFMPDILL